MKLSPSLEVIMTLAAHEAQAGGHVSIRPEHVFMALLKLCEVNVDMLGRLIAEKLPMESFREEVEELRAQCARVGMETKSMRRDVRSRLGRGPGNMQPGMMMHRSSETKTVFDLATVKAGGSGADRVRAIHFLFVILTLPNTALLKDVMDRAGIDRKQVYLDSPPDDQPASVGEAILSPAPTSLGELTSILKEMRAKLLDTVFGQEQAVHAFTEGLFNAEVVAASDEDRRRPKGVFVFAGPPGVGKTYLAESGVAVLGKPFKRFDMSGYSDSMGVVLLAGAQRSYQGAKQGQLTGFVKDNPDAVLLFDEIEKASADVIHLFLQLLDNGSLEDKFTEENVLFRDTVIILTTNAGRSLYSEPTVGSTGKAVGALHRKTILNALETDTDPRTGRRFFPAAICSRLATGYPVMFNHLGVNELERIAAREMERVGGLMGKEYGLKLRLGESVPLALVMREGVRTDARTVRSQAESFVKSEMFRFASLYTPERLQSVLDSAEEMLIDLDPDQHLDEEVSELLGKGSTPSLLLAASPDKASVVSKALPGLELTIPVDGADAREQLALKGFDFVVLDLWFDAPAAMGGDSMKTVQFFDHVPQAARAIHGGQELLRHIHRVQPELPVFLLSMAAADGSGVVDDELLLACSRSGGVRGLVQGNSSDVSGLSQQVGDVAIRMCRERQAEAFGSKSRALVFDTAPAIDQESGDIHIRIRNVGTVQAVSADDISSMVSDAERPTTLFRDVLGADQAKSELGFIVDWLRDPRRYAGLDLKPPRGILMYGPPGTGKTMLARALAGESNVSFIAESATNFVTKYVGSGPESIRNLFSRARRYAPSILFIDEIDAIGKKRSGGDFNRPQEETLNSLLTEMDGFSTSASKPVIVLAATNLVESLDEALVRRFDREVEVDKPDRAARQAYLEKRLAGKPGKGVSSGVIARLAGQSAGMSIAQLERVIRLASRTAAMQGGPVTDAIMEEAFESMRMGELKGPEADPETLLRVARHEAGHCLVGWLRGDKPVQVTIVARGKAGGFVEREADENRMLYLKSDLEGMIRQSMAGRAAEILYYGSEGGLSSGVSGDLETATHWAGLMVRQFGMSSDLGQVALDGKRIGDGPLADKVMASVQAIVSGQMDMAVSLLEENKDTLDELVDRLMEKNRLTREELEQFMPQA